jgi:hypothetical protein
MGWRGWGQAAERETLMQAQERMAMAVLVEGAAKKAVVTVARGRMRGWRGSHSFQRDF